MAAKHPEFHRIVTVIADTGQRYLSGELFGERPDVRRARSRLTTIDAETLERVAAHRDRLSSSADRMTFLADRADRS